MGIQRRLDPAASGLIAKHRNNDGSLSSSNEYLLHMLFVAYNTDTILCVLIYDLLIRYKPTLLDLISVGSVLLWYMSYIINYIHTRISMINVACESKLQ